ALSVQVSKLEKELGVRLFVRTARSVRLTPAGKELVKRAADILALTRETCGVMRQFAAQESEHIAVGIEETPGCTGLPALISSFEKQHPDVLVSLVESAGDDLPGLLDNGEIDIAVFALPPDIAGRSSEVEFVEFYADSDKKACLAFPRRPYVSKAAQSFRRFALERA
ncbi:MAG TPA: LysR family transcriptional regulator, partial [Negativicutes bacterium]|nr:LysR family transcriptional regulator [Negativicutes bacterium]